MFEKYKEQISIFLTDFLARKQIDLGKINHFGKDTVDKLQFFVQNGKMFRGSLLLLTEEKFGKPTRDGLIIAGALELIQAGILIHDDVIDQDTTRRGQKSIYAQYADFGKSKNISNPVHFGHSLGICLGDIVFFLAFEMINDLANDLQIKQQIIKMLSIELQTVGLAEMQDTYFGVNTEIPAEKDILDLYRTKTGRYSFSLPLILGAKLTRQPEEIIQELEKLGEVMGLIYQIKDDELSLFGDSQVTGKPVGTDIMRTNKTLYYLYLMEKASNEEKILLNNIFGNKNITFSEIEYVRNLVKSLSIDQKINLKLDKLNSDALEILKKIDVAQEFKSEINSLLILFLKRNK